MITRVLTGLLAISIAGVVLACGGLHAIAYLVVFVLALVPGLPVGFRLFGRQHAASWITGALLGYFLTSLSLWLVIASGKPRAWLFVLAWAGITTLTAWLCRDQHQPLATLEPWTGSDSRALVLVSFLVLAIAVPPFLKVGAERDGDRYYRAYFTADFVWHTALSAELAKFSMPPRNPFMAGRRIHYYWAYFLLPSSVAGAAPGMSEQIETNLKVNAIGTALLFVGVIFIAAWSAVPRASAVGAAVALTIVASSAEGAYAIARLESRGQPLSQLKDLNIDAIANWWGGGLRVDGLQRCFWWVPQHSMAYALGLGGFVVLAANGPATVAGSLVAGLMLAGSVAFNPFVGGILSLAWGTGALVSSLGTPRPLHSLARSALAAIPVAAALAWCSLNQMAEGAGSVVEFGALGAARHNPIGNLLLSLGPALVPAVVGTIAVIAGASKSISARRLAAPVALLLIALAVMHFVRLRVDDSWVGFRAGQMILISVPALIAAGLAAVNGLRVVAIATSVLACALGLPTTVVDLYNAQDISNLAAGPGFPWTQVLDRSHREALDWIRHSTASDATVQQDALSRHRTTWWVVPTFGHRRMAGGLPPFMVDNPEYHEKSELVRAMYAASDGASAANIARRLRIDFVYVDEVERKAYPHANEILGDTRYFQPTFTNNAVQIYAVR